MRMTSWGDLLFATFWAVCEASNNSTPSLVVKEDIYVLDVVNVEWSIVYNVVIHTLKL